jgi:hypothetical protein
VRVFARRRQREAEEAHARWQSQVAAFDDLVEQARTFRGLDPSQLPPMSIQVGTDERVYGVFDGAALIEPRVSGGHWAGRSQGFSIPVVAGVRYRVGASKGHYVKGEDTPTIIDAGTAVVTDRRALFAGPKQTREWLWSKCIAIAHHDEAPWTVISVSNRQKSSGIGYDEAHATEIRLRIDLAHAVATGTEERLIATLTEARDALAANAPGGPQAAAAAPAVAAPPGWYPDPRGRFEQRYWDGHQWTDRVSSARAESTDPV